MKKRGLLIVCCLFVLMAGTGRAGGRDEAAFRYLESGRTFLSQGRDADGLKDLESVVEGFPDSPAAPQALEMIYQYYLDRKQRAKALDAMDRLITRYPSTTIAGRAMVLRGMTRMKTLLPGDIEQAEADFHRAVQIFPDSDVSDLAQVGLAQIQLLYRRLDEADRILTRVMIRRSSGPAYEAALDTKTQCLLLRGRPLDAMTVIQRRRISGETEAESQTRADLALLKRLFLEIDTSLQIDPAFNAMGAHMKKPADIITDTDGNLNVLDTGRSLLLILDPSSGTVIKRRSVTETIHHLNTGIRGVGIMIGETFISRESRQTPIVGADFLRRIVDACWSAPGRWWIIDKKQKGILQFDDKGAYVGTTQRGIDPDGSERILPCPTGGTWLLHPKSRRILYFDIKGNPAGELKFQGPGYTMEKPVDISADRFGHLYVLDETLKKVFVFNAGMQKIHVFSCPATNLLRKPLALLVGNDGSLYIADRKAKTVYHLN